MSSYNDKESNVSGPLRIKVRFDYQGTGRGGRFLRAGKNALQAAEEIREQKVNFLRNVPLQGIHIEDIDVSQDVYTVYDEIDEETVGFAPLTVQVMADSIEDVLKFIMKEEFRKVEVLEPNSITLSKMEVERLLFRINEEMREYRDLLMRKLEGLK